MLPHPLTTSAATDPRFRGAITAVLVLMIVVMIAKDIFTRRRHRLRGSSRRDISFVVR